MKPAHTFSGLVNDGRLACRHLRHFHLAFLHLDTEKPSHKSADVRCTRICAAAAAVFSHRWVPFMQLPPPCFYNA
jgi:hypothetical protein